MYEIQGNQGIHENPYQSNLFMQKSSASEMINRINKAREDEELELEGIVEYVKYYNEERDFVIFNLIIKKGMEDRKQIMVVGRSGELHRDTEVRVRGILFMHKQFGEQIKASCIEMMKPATMGSILAYFERGNVKGIGSKRALKLYKEFGDDLFDIIENDWERLIDVVGEDLAREIHEVFEDQMGNQRVIAYLAQLGLSATMSQRVYQHFKENTISILESNIYRLTDVKGIGFNKADEIAKNIGIEGSDPRRLTAGAIYATTQYATDGHCAYPKGKFVDLMANILKADRKLCYDHLNQMISDKDDERLVEDTIHDEPYIFSNIMYYMERKIARNIYCLMSSKSSVMNILSYSSTERFCLEDDIRNAEIACQRNLAESQKQAVIRSLSSKVSIITGGPGVGKTTIIKVIINILKSKYIEVCLAAPTGRASRRMSEATGHKASTIHRLLGYTGGTFRYNEENKLDGKRAYILDESSMIDTFLFNSFLNALPQDVILIMVGDKDQLPSVGAGQILKDLIESNMIPTSRLTEIFRQDEESRIVKNAHAINNGRMPDLNNIPNGDFFYSYADTPVQCCDNIIKMLTERVPKIYPNFDLLKDVQVLCPMRGSGVGTDLLNKLLQNALNQNAHVISRYLEVLQKKGNGEELSDEDISAFMIYKQHTIPYLAYKGKIFTIGDKVMQLKNNYDKEVFNGDVGIIDNIYMEDKKLNVMFERGEDGDLSVEYDYDEFLREVTLSYACTIHKSQGSEYDMVLIPMMKANYIMLKRKLLYTAVTRGKKVVVLVGQKEAIWISTKGKDDDFFRYTKLSEWLKDFFLGKEDDKQEQKQKKSDAYSYPLQDEYPEPIPTTINPASQIIPAQPITQIEPVSPVNLPNMIPSYYHDIVF